MRQLLHLLLLIAMAAVASTAIAADAPRYNVLLIMADDHDGARPWRGIKRDSWEGGHRVPFVVRWPGKVKAGTSSAQLSSLTDVMATVAAIIGAKLPDNAAEDSFSLLPALLDDAHAPIRPYLLQQAFGGARTLSIRRGDWKYLDHTGSGGNRYESDPGLKPFHLAEAGVPVIVGTGAQNPARAAAHAAHAQRVGAKGLMVIPRLMSRGTSPAAQRAHFAGVLAAAPNLAAVIYNSPYYGFETKAPLFFDLRREHPNLVGFKEFGGADSLSYAAEHITHADSNVLLMVGVDTQVCHGYIHCGAVGAITGIGNCLPREVLHLISLCKRAAAGDVEARRLAWELEEAFTELSRFDEGPDLVLYYKYLLVLLGDPDYELNFNESDQLSPSQKHFAEAQIKLFQQWWNNWPGK